MSEKTLPKKRYTQAEAGVLKLVRGDYNAAKTGLQNNSYHSTKDWFKVWEDQEKIAIGYSEKSNPKEFKSNVKSPMSSGRIDSTMQKLRKLDIQFVVRPDDVKDDKDKRKGRVVQELLNNLFQRRALKARMNTWFQDTLTHGSGYLHVYYLQKKRKVKMPKIDTEKMTSEEKQLLKDNKKVYEKTEIVDYDDIAFEPVKIQEIFVDPSGRNLHGTSYEAQYIIRRMLPSYSQFKAMCSNDKDAKNVNKVRPASYYNDSDVAEFFEPPKDIENDDYVEVLHYYNKAKDRYIVVANDVVVKDIPLPYIHKQLPFVKIDCKEVLNQLNGMGIPDSLKNIQGEEEILKNLVYDRLHITANPMVKVKKTIYGEFSKSYQTAEPGLMLPVNQMDDVQTLDYQSMNFDMFRGIEALDRDAVLATQIDPVQMGVNQKYVSATTSMLTKEQMDGYISALIDLWSESMIILAKQCISLMSQFYTVPRVDSAAKAAQSRQIRLTDIEINPESMEVKETRGEYSYLKIKPDYFNINGDWDIELSPESVEVKSRAIEMQKSQAALAQLAPFMVDPNNPESVMQSPTPWIDGPKVLRWYTETNGIPSDVRAITEEDSDIAIERAKIQGKQLIMGEVVSGIPGENETHKKVHVEQLKLINSRKAEIEKMFEPYGEEIMPQLMQTTEWQELEQIQKIAQEYADHLMEDDKAKVMEVPSAIMGGKPPAPAQQPQVPMPPGLTPAGGSQPPMPAGGNQQSGMAPQGGQQPQGGQSQVPQQGRPPMAAM